MNIQGISQKIFRKNEVSNNEVSKSNHTNPFGVNFKGNIISADVFENKKSDLPEAKARNKFSESAFVGSINAFGSAIGRRLDSIVSFGRRIKDTTTDLWAQANRIDMSEFLASRLNMPSFSGAYSVRNLTRKPVSVLEDLLSQELSANEA